MVARKSSSKPKTAPRADTERASCKARARIALHAGWQLASVLDGIREIARKTSDKDLQGRFLALAMRATDLNEVATTAMSEPRLEKDGVVELWRTLNTDDLGTGTEVAYG